MKYSTHKEVKIMLDYSLDDREIQRHQNEKERRNKRKKKNGVGVYSVGCTGCFGVSARFLRRFLS